MTFVPVTKKGSAKYLHVVSGNHLLDSVNDKGVRVPDPDGWHHGITTKKRGRYFVLIHEPVLQGDVTAWAEVVSAAEALDYIIKRNCLTVLDRPDLAELKELQATHGCSS